MRILLIGNPNSVHVYNYIKYVLSDLGKDGLQIFLFSFNNGSINKLRYSSFYRKNNIHLFIPAIPFCFPRKIPKINGLISILSSYIKFCCVMIKYKEFDYLHIHFADPSLGLILKSFKKHFGKIITTFWGGDLLQVKQKNIKKTDAILSVSTIITVATDTMEQHLYKVFGSKYKNKVKHAKFGLPVLDAIIALELQESREDSKRLLHIPNDKIIITCGYNASPLQQHKLMINAINNCTKEIRDQLYVIFPLAYPIDPQYLSELKNYLKHCGFEYFMDTKFLNEINTARLRRASDILLHAQVFDAFSGSVQEHIYADNIVFNGSWLNYPVMDAEGIYYVKFKDEEDLTVKLSAAIINLSYLKAKIKEKSGLIYQISSWNQVKGQWHSLYQ